MNMVSALAQMQAGPARLPEDERVRRWTELAAHASEPNPFYHPALLIPALDLLDDHGVNRPLEAYAGDQLIGLLPVEPMVRHGRYPFANVVNMTHPHCFFGAPLLRAGQESAAWAALLAQLDDARWSGQFLYLTGQDEAGPVMAALRNVCVAQSRPYGVTGRYERAMLHSDLSAGEYWTTHVRAKKRKELRRLVNRLEETGAVTHRRLTDVRELPLWCADFLALEASGWKGNQGTALDSRSATRDYFFACCDNAYAADMLDMLRIDVDGRAIAMLVNFRHLRGAFSFKIAIDENFGRYSPGILIELDNLYAVQGDDRLDWMDSCATPDHPMIDSLWAERRSIVQARIALRGTGSRRTIRAISYRLTTFVEELRRRIKGWSKL